jgi:large subunit ribosomal protein L20
MPRVRRGTKKRERRSKILKLAKGYWGARSRNYRTAKEAVERALLYAYRDRRTRKRDFRRLWIIRIKAAAESNGLSGCQLAPGFFRDSTESKGCKIRKVEKGKNGAWPHKEMGPGPNLKMNG